MPLDTILTLLNVVWGLVLTGIGIEMVNNPPDVKWKRWFYRSVFLVFGCAVIFTTAFQSVHNSNEQEHLRANAQSTEQALSNKVSEQGGKLDAIAHFEQQFLQFVSQHAGGAPDASTKAYEAMALSVMKMAQGSPPAPNLPGGPLEIKYEGAELSGRTVTTPLDGANLPLSAFHTTNVGARAAGPVSARLYFSKQIGSITPFWQATDSDESSYPWAFYCGGPMSVAVINPTETWNWQPFVGQINPNWGASGETIEAKIKFYYGADKPAVANFTIKKK